MKNEKLAEQLRLAAEIIEKGLPWEVCRFRHQEWFLPNPPIVTEWMPPEYEIRIKPEPAFTLPPPPPSMRWHREDGWKEGDLPQGWRPLVLGERVSLDDEWKNWDNKTWQTWHKRTQIFGEESDGANNRIHAQHRTKRPLTFTHEGKEWTWHRVGDPMPCDGEKEVCLMRKNREEFHAVAIPGKAWEWIDPAIIGWRYAEPVMVPLGPEDILPGSFTRHKAPNSSSDKWTAIVAVGKDAVVIGDTGISFNELREGFLINRSLPKTGKWDASAWEDCCKPAS